MTPEAVARLRARTARGGATAQGGLPSGKALHLARALVLLRLRAAAQNAVANRVANRPAARQVIPFDKEAVGRFIGQSVQDAVLAKGLDAVGGWAKDAIGSAALGSLGIPGLGSAGLGTSLETVASALSAAAPVAAFGTVAAGLAVAAIDIFGGEVAIPTYATTPQLDATTALGQAAARAQAPLLRESLRTQGTKFGFKGERDPAGLL